MAKRLVNLIKKLPLYDDGKKIDAALIVSEVNRRYFSGFKSSAGVIFVTRDEGYFIVDFRYYEAALNQVKNMKIVLAADLKSEILNIINRHEIKNILLENEGITLAEVLKFEKWAEEINVNFIKTKTLDDIIHSLRAVKTNDEIESIDNCARNIRKSLEQTFTDDKIGYNGKGNCI